MGDKFYSGIVREYRQNFNCSALKQRRKVAATKYAIESLERRVLLAANYVLSTLASFNLTPDGAYPKGDLVFDAAGNLYGTTNYGGADSGGDSYGTVFKVSAGTHSFSTLGTFAPASAPFSSIYGAYPAAGLIADSAGNLYGTTTDGGGIGDDGSVYEMSAIGSVFSTLATFKGANGGINGATPMGELVSDAAGNLYGTASQGGANGFGTVFELVAGSQAITTLASFDGTNGENPEGRLISDASGNLYGTTAAGGGGGGSFNGDGTIFELAAGTNTITTLATFNGTNGSNPHAGLIADAAGNLYGTTYQGGANNDGTVFEMAAGMHTLSTLATFNSTNGQNPQGRLTADAGGNLYGTTYGGGANSDGTVFEITAGTHALTTLVSFNGANGKSPEAGLIFDAAGNLYGTTVYGGSGYGTVFELVAPASAESIVVTPPAAQTATAGISDAFTLGSFTQATAAGPFTVDVNWGDGSADTKFSLPTTGTIPTHSHIYSSATTDTASITVTDANGKVSNKATFAVTVAPAGTASIIVSAPAAQATTAGVSKTFALGSFNETGATGPFAVDVNWGDGSADTLFSLAAAGAITAQTHTFSKAANDWANVLVTNAAGNVWNSSAEFAITVARAPGAVSVHASLSAKPLKKVQTWYSFTAIYSGPVAIDTKSLDRHDILVRGPDGYRRYASFVSFTANASGKTVTAVYRVKGTGSRWSKSNNGTYHVYVGSKQVADKKHDFVVAGLMGSFKVQLH